MGYKSRNNAIPNRLILIFLVLSISIIVVGYLFYRDQKEQIKKNGEQELAAIADLKVKRIKDWRDERLMDASFIFNNAEIADHVLRLQKHQASPGDKAATLKWMDAMYKNLQYKSICLVDREGKILVSMRGEKTAIHTHSQSYLHQALQSEKIFFSDLYRGDDQNIYLDVVVPILIRQNDKPYPVGAVSLRIDPWGFLYPLIQSWPTPSKTAESYLIRREGNDIVFLNELRHRKDTALSLRFPITKKEFPAAMAVQGATGIIEGIDYRDVPVLAALRPIPDSPWFLVAKVDIDEVFAPNRVRFILIGLLISILIVSSGLSVILFWKHGQTKFYELQHEERKQAEEQLLKLNRTLRALSNSSQAMMHAKDESWYLNEVCRIVVEECGHALVWIGYAEEDEYKTVRPVAHAGFEEGYIESLKITWADTERGRGPVGTAIRTGKPSVFRNILSDPSFAPWREEAMKRGYAAAISVPLMSEGKAFGSLNIYSRFPDPFSEDEINLLTNLADDLAYGINAIRLRDARARAEEALRESEKLYHSLFENILNGFAYCKMIFYQDRPQDFIYLAVNRAFEVLTGLKNVVGKKVSEVIPGLRKSDPYLFEIYGRVALTGTPEKVEIYVEALNMWFSISVYSPEKEYFVAVFDVITERKRAEEEKQKLEAQLLQAQKMEAVGQLAGGIAHDFNNILTAVIGYAHVLKIRMKEDDPLRTFPERILLLSDKAANLTQSLLAFSRKQIMNPRPVNLNGVIRTVGKLLLRIIGEDIRLQTVLSENDPIVMADHVHIEQVLMNLAANARDAMPEGGVLNIGTETVDIDDKYVKEHGFGKEGEYALISVTDTGIGMDRETREKIFEPFFTTKEVGKGTGLGLSMIYGIIKQHDGYINVYSEPGKGTTFRIYLPVIQTKAEEPEAEVMRPIETGTETILVAEDETDVREFTKKLLEDYGYTVVEAIDGEDAIGRFNLYKDKIQLVLLDVIMPKRNGREVYEEIKKVMPDVKVVFTSGYPADHINEMMEKGTEVVLKPISPTKLLKKVREVLDK